MRGPALALCLILYGASHAARQEAVPLAGTAPPVTLTLRIPGERRQFRPGEMIPIQLEFTSPVPRRFVVDGATYDRSGRLTIDDFVLEPNEHVSDPLLDMYGAGAGVGGGLRSMGVLGEKPVTVNLELNDWFRFDTPGVYRLSVRSHRVTDDGERANGRAEVPVNSDTVTFEILPRDREWEAQQVAEAIDVLDGRIRGRDERRACRILRFVGSDAAVDEMVKRYDDTRWGCAFEYQAGLFTAVNRDYVILRMEEGLRASDQPVTRSFLRTLAMLAVYRNHPELRPPQTRVTKGRLPAFAELVRHPDLIAETQKKYAAVLAAALPDKTPRARGIGVVENLDDSTTGGAGAPTRADDRSTIASTFFQLPAERQRRLLEYEWHRVAGPAMLPVLRRIVAAGPAASREVLEIALKRLYQLDSVEGRARIFDQIRNPSPGVSLRTLGLLPDRELPELDDVLVANVDANGGPAFSIRLELLQRYASAAVAPRVLARFSDSIGTLACRPQAAVLAYILRAEATVGAALLDRALASRASTGCHRRVLPDVAAFHMDPAIEAAAIAHLDDPDAEVVASAAETLGRFGSAAALGPLRARLERWHETWQGREDEVRYRYVRQTQSVEGIVEWRLVEALARGRAWLTSRDTLEDLRRLCVTDNCRQQVGYASAEAGRGHISVTRVEEPNESLITVDQYNLESLAALEEKLAQYPRGASFTLNTGTLDAGTAAIVKSRLRKIADAHGITLR